MFTPGSGATQETGDGIKRAEAWARLVARPPGGAEESAVSGLSLRELQ